MSSSVDRDFEIIKEEVDKFYKFFVAKRGKVPTPPGHLYMVAMALQDKNGDDYYRKYKYGCRATRERVASETSYALDRFLTLIFEEKTFMAEIFESCIKQLLVNGAKIPWQRLAEARVALIRESTRDPS